MCRYDAYEIKARLWKCVVGITRAAMHPDGVILGTGNEASVCKMWDIKDQSCVCTFTGHSNGAITALAFSENGYYLATAAEDHTIKLYLVYCESC